MTKIYEALENAQKGRKGLEIPEIPSSHPPISPSSHFPILSSSPVLDMEEEMVGLYQTITSLLPDSPKKVVQFIGSREGEGTSTVVREFAKVSAIKFGKSVLLLDADLSKPSQPLFFNIHPEFGLEEVVQENKLIDQAIYPIGETNLSVSVISTNSSSSPQIFNNPGFDPFWRELKQGFDFILVDSPPATTSPDGLAISPRVDGVILVLEAENTRWPVAESARDKITKSGGKILGIVLNKRKYYIPEFIYRRL